MSQSPFQDPNARSYAGPFECTLTAGGERAAWVHVSGELDLATSRELESTLRQVQRDARLIVLDAREVSFIDCAGLNAILAVARGGWGVPRLLVMPSAAVRRLLELTCLREEIWTIEIVPDIRPRGRIPVFDVSTARPCEFDGRRRTRHRHAGPRRRNEWHA